MRLHVEPVRNTRDSDADTGTHRAIIVLALDSRVPRTIRTGIVASFLVNQAHDF